MTQQNCFADLAELINAVLELYFATSRDRKAFQGPSDSGQAILFTGMG
jgi:hypothetical protein